MTWQEFRDAVDRQIAERGYDDSILLSYIDWPGGWTEDEVTIGISDCWADGKPRMNAS
jgi:hypothetical protein